MGTGALVTGQWATEAAAEETRQASEVPGKLRLFVCERRYRPSTWRLRAKGEDLNKLAPCGALSSDVFDVACSAINRFQFGRHKNNGWRVMHVLFRDA